MELNREQTKKALEWCYAEGTCGECPYQKICFEVSQWQILRDALAIINSQEQRIKELNEENERLMRDKTALECIVATARNQAKADTVRKMHSMLCEGRVSNDNVVIVANQVAKEMLEGAPGNG